ncbi:MAG: DUF4450 domain-containing protein [Bacteroidales bacterium]|nr:DUF4450 domain-containing protein [Bacteroidales bacterium]
MHRIEITVLLSNLLLGAALAQTNVSAPVQKQLFTANEAPKFQQILAPRKVQYWPEDDGIVCIDGKNRFTRALYGRCEAARLETSDEPEFGLYMPYMGGNVRFDIEHVQIRTSYDGVSRDYRIVLPDSMKLDAGSEAYVILSAYALQIPAAGGIWQIEGHNVKPGVQMRMRYGAATNASFSRNGDLGVDKPDCFDFTADKCKGNDYTIYAQQSCFDLTYGKGSKRGERRVHGQVSPCVKLALAGAKATDGTSVNYLTADIPLSQPSIIAIGNASDSVCNLQTMLFESESQACALVGDYAVQTPDVLLNPLEYVLPAAANGIWDEASGVWQHGAIGWRMPLPGWRAAYVGDVMGWPERQQRHFSGYAASQLVDVEVNKSIPVLDPAKNLARATEKLGNPMFTTGYIGRYPNNAKKVNHYDMNLVFIDELLWHLNWSGDIEEARFFWPTIVRHLAWEKRVFDPDGDGLYDAYCCIWASDGLYYGGGAATHSTAYNLRANRQAAKIAKLLGDNDLAEKYSDEADKIQRAIDEHLWLDNEGVWAECKDAWGLKRQHRNPAVWTIYHAIDSEVGTPLQRYRATQYVDKKIPHYAISVADGGRPETRVVSDASADVTALATTSWQPYGWSINNVALAEEMHTAFAYWQAGRPDEAYSLFKGALMDGMYLGASPGNLGQISFYDAARGECYRDFGDPVGITARTFVQGLIGIQPDLLSGVLTLRPGFPTAWDGKEVSFSMPDFEFRRSYRGDTAVWYFRGNGDFFDRYDSIVVYAPAKSVFAGELADASGICWVKSDSLADALRDQVAAFDRKAKPSTATKGQQVRTYTDPSAIDFSKLTPVASIAKRHNLKVADIFKQNYSYKGDKHKRVTLSMPSHGMGEWCHPTDTFNVSDALGLKAAFTSQWKNFPNKLSFKLPKMSASHIYLKMVGTTNPMQSRIENGIVRVHYTDGTCEALVLENPVNWWPIEQELVQGLPAFYLSDFKDDVQPPYRMSLRTGKIYRPETDKLNISTDGGAATLLEMSLNPAKTVKSLEVECLSNDVLIGIIDAYLQTSN